MQQERPSTDTKNEEKANKKVNSICAIVFSISTNKPTGYEHASGRSSFAVNTRVSQGCSLLLRPVMKCRTAAEKRISVYS